MLWIISRSCRELYPYLPAVDGCTHHPAVSPAAINGLSPEDAQGRVAAFLKHQLSVALVLDLGLGSALALTEAAVEFVGRCAASRATTASWPAAESVQQQIGHVSLRGTQSSNEYVHAHTYVYVKVAACCCA
jgi:hypothetical protein